MIKNDLRAPLARGTSVVRLSLFVVIFLFLEVVETCNWHGEMTILAFVWLGCRAVVVLPVPGPKGARLSRSRSTRLPDERHFGCTFEIVQRIVLYAASHFPLYA